MLRYDPNVHFIWKLITNLPVDSLSKALEKIGWYALRWKIEVFHKILKSGCRAEESKLRSTERLTRLVAVFCILSWRVFWMTMIQRVRPAEPAEVVSPPVPSLKDVTVSDTPRDVYVRYHAHNPVSTQGQMHVHLHNV